jgi:hypothetical protein
MRKIPLALLLLVSACTTYPRVRTDFDPSANFATYHSYTWIPVDVPRGMNPLMFRRIQGSIDHVLQARGYTSATPGDFAVAFTVGERDRVESSPGWGWGWGYGSGWGWGGGWAGGWGYGGGWGWGGPWGPAWNWGWGGSDVYTVTDRSLIVDIYDVPTKRAVWHGTITRTTWPESEVDYAKLDVAVNTLLAAFPPQPTPPPGTVPLPHATAAPAH